MANEQAVPVQYGFLDGGDPGMNDEVIVIGPYPTEEEATTAANGRTVIAIQPPLADDGFDTADDTDDLSVCRTDGCDGDGDCGDSYDGYCPSCADVIAENPNLQNDMALTLNDINTARDAA